MKLSPHHVSKCIENNTKNLYFSEMPPDSDNTIAGSIESFYTSRRFYPKLSPPWSRHPSSWINIGSRPPRSDTHVEQSGGISGIELFRSYLRPEMDRGLSRRLYNARLFNTQRCTSRAWGRTRLVLTTSCRTKCVEVLAFGGWTSCSRSEYFDSYHPPRLINR